MFHYFSLFSVLHLSLLAQLVDRVFDESLNFRKIPPVISTNKAPEINGKPVELRPRAPDSLEPRALRRRTWNREEVRASHQKYTTMWPLKKHLQSLSGCFKSSNYFSSMHSGGVGQPAAQFSFSAVH